MHIVIERIYMFRALQHVLGVVGGNRPSMPILGHMLLQVRDGVLFVTGSDIDIEIIVSIPIHTVYEVGSITVPARKFFDICRALSDQSKIILKYQEDKLFIYSKNSYFSLVTFSALDFPSICFWKSEVEFSVSLSVLKDLIEATQFSMGKQDVRYYLNGMLFSLDKNKLDAVATDGHRLAMCTVLIFSEVKKIKTPYSIIIPRKYIMNLVRVLSVKEKDVQFKIGKRNISVNIGNYILTSKLINGIFPDYKSVFPKESTNILQVGSNLLQKSIRRSVILCNEKFHIVKFLLGVNQLKIVSKNSENEMSEQILDVIYSGRDMEIGFNVYYILDILNVIKSEEVQFLLTDANSSVQIISYPISMSTYVVMPILL